MKLDLLRDRMNMILKDSRYLHCLGVEEVSCDLAVIYGCDLEKACIAGLVHDCAKNINDDNLLEECRAYNIPVSEIEMKSPHLLHAKVGAYHAKVQYEIEDDDILNAITYHTTGRPGMSLLEKIIFTADYIEPYREELPRIYEIRKAAYDNKLDQAIVMILENTLDYLQNTGAVIDTLTKDTYEYYKTELLSSTK
ncbi:bis(5'-nucleosyl)-tetraphosphatase (symmetrical) YqeK [Mobilitalea sibirica]|uniref:bis(5'-nucleosyl)-tetraphosphatase (symmetrical) n=1 Tax=Mobilitalea sibirica TaxID=1462919 RepID=A0A8J7KT43_9FIRM|nr:bis(5'-nucleosyl)-tetraphosphatase (symmetrical) YqeK [Mobilitalea sibirica]MBH1940971.1 bis(5'-nucleosyl)-tetraphosphatase (symmetrical) YqeK [Mobilitalea sibirica]